MQGFDLSYTPTTFASEWLPVILLLAGLSAFMFGVIALLVSGKARFLTIPVCGMAFVVATLVSSNARHEDAVSTIAAEVHAHYGVTPEGFSPRKDDQSVLVRTEDGKIFPGRLVMNDGRAILFGDVGGEWPTAAS